MSMGIEIKRIVQDLGRVTIEQVLHEAIMNSIQANAHNIDIKISYQALGKNSPCMVDSMSITDDGEGFTVKNTESFETYKTTHKQNMGAKGVGRFLFLKLFNNIFISSLDKNIKFDINDVVVSTVTNSSEQTIINFSSAKKDIVLDLKLIESNIEEHFLPYFHLMKNDPTVVINLTANDEKIFSISSEDIPDFKTDKFQLKKHEFTIAYVLDYYDEQKNNGFYCANNRVVIKNNKDEKTKLKSFQSVNILFLLSSEYLNKKINDTRDDFLIHPKQKNSTLGDLSWSEIQDAFSEKLKNILLANDINVEKQAKVELDKAIDEAPYLSGYLIDNEYSKDSTQLIAEAEKKLTDDKKILRGATYNNEQERKQKLSIVTHSELAEYIYDRQKIIDNLKNLTHRKTLEKEIHNLFMEQNTTDEKRDYKSNNLWLFDDRFMVYDKVFSEKQIKEIFPGSSGNLHRPDILSIVSNTYNKDDIRDIVIIELKKPDNKTTPAGAEEQLLDYASDVNSSNADSSNADSKIRIWTYAFLKFNKETCKKLKNKDYNEVPTQSKYSIYYKYYEKDNVIINFMDYDALADDANTRNKTFMNILSGKSS